MISYILQIYVFDDYGDEDYQDGDYKWVALRGCFFKWKSSLLSSYS